VTCSGTPPPLWRIEDHVCSRCFGRVLSRPAGTGVNVYRCADCGLSATGRSARVICSCGIKLRGTTDMGIRCIRNERPTPEFMVEICARQN